MKNSAILLLGCLFPLVAIADNIRFYDDHVKSVCVQNWDTSGDGELSMEEAAAVTQLSTKFSFDSEITRFPELQYFTGLRSITTYEFYSCNNLVSINLPPQITTIGTSAFYGCSKLQQIEIPEAVHTVSDYAFNGCNSLQSITFHEGLTSIGDYAFSYCSSLQRIDLPASLTSISLSAFWSCSSLNAITVNTDNTVYDSREDCNGLILSSTNTLQFGITTTVIPVSVTTIGPSAFYGNSKIETMDIPEGVETIGGSAFSGCTALATVSLPSTLTSIGNSAFSGCKKLTNITLQEGLETIGESAFKSCSNLRKVFIPSTVTKIDYSAFAESSRLRKVAVAATTPITIAASVFPYYKSSTLYVPKGCLEAYKNAKIWKDFMNVVELDNNITASVTPEQMEYDTEATLTLNLANDDFFSYQSVQMDITLPQHFTLDADNIALSDRCAGMTVSLMPLEDNTYRLTCTSENASISGTEGGLINLKIKGNAPTGNYQGIVNNAVLTSENGTQPLDDAEFSWSVLGYPLGDVNHDGDVDVADVMLVVNYVLDYESSAVFYIENADVNGDGSVGVSDVMGIVNIVLDL